MVGVAVEHVRLGVCFGITVHMYRERRGAHALRALTDRWLLGKPNLCVCLCVVPIEYSFSRSTYNFSDRFLT